MKAPIPKERSIQVTVAEYLDLALPPDAILLGQAGGDGKVTTTPGYKSGTPDLQILHRQRSIFIEMKRPKVGRTAEEQAKLQRRIEICGGVCFTARTLEDVVRIVEQLIPGMKRVTL